MPSFRVGQLETPSPVFYGHATGLRQRRDAWLEQRVIGKRMVAIGRVRRLFARARDYHSESRWYRGLEHVVAGHSGLCGGYKGHDGCNYRAKGSSEEGLGE